MMIIIIGNGNGLAARGTHPHRASWIRSCGGCGLCIYNMGLVFFWVGFYRVAHVKIPLSSVVFLFGTGEKTALLFTDFFGNYFEYLLKHWSGQTWESRYISLPASIKCKPDSHNQRPDSPNEHFSLWSPKPMLYFIKLGGAHRPPPPHSYRRSSPGDGKDAVQHDTPPVLYLRLFLPLVSLACVRFCRWRSHAGCSREGGGRRLLVDDGEWG